MNSFVGTFSEVHLALDLDYQHVEPEETELKYKFASSPIRELSDVGRDWLKPEQSRLETYVPGAET